MIIAKSTPTNWTQVGAVAAWATVAIYLALGIFAWVQVLQARKLRRDQARPFVIVDFEPGFVVYLTVETLGKTMARDVTIKFDKPLETTLKRPRELDDTPLFREPTATFPPGKKIRILLDSISDRVTAGLPLTYTVTVKYRGTASEKPFEETYKLDLGMYLGSEPPKELPQLVAEVKEIRQEMAKWKGRNLDGLLVHTTDTRRQERINRRRLNAY